jgi:hypothetical protein
MIYRWLADVTAGVHFAYVCCVVFGLVAILLGKALGWQWVHNRWFRSIHLLMIVGVIIRAVFLPVCPLTTWESDLRDLAGQKNFEGSPVGWWLHALIHPDDVGWHVPLWVFLPVYAAFGLLIVGALWLVPVHWRPKRQPLDPLRCVRGPDGPSRARSAAE